MRNISGITDIPGFISRFHWSIQKSGLLILVISTRMIFSVIESTLLYRCLELKRCFERNEKEKKRQYNERVLQIENGTFTPLVFATNGAMSRECQAFYKRMAEMVAEKRKVHMSVATSVIRTKISFSLVRSMLRCIRGSRSRSPINSNLSDFHLADQAQIRRTQ